MNAPEAKKETMQFRLSPYDKALIAEAAAYKHLQNSAYIRESVVKQAEIDLANKREYMLSENEMANFLKALDRPATSKPKLRDLLSKKTVLET